MKREELERLIVDASDGILNVEETEKLERELRSFPDLLEDYQAIMNLPELATLYQTELEFERHQSSIHAIKQRVREMANKTESFEMITLDWFRKYALAASIAIFAITSVFSFIQSQNIETESEMVAEEYFYPADESTTESYVLYLEEMAEE